MDADRVDVRQDRLLELTCLHGQASALTWLVDEVGISLEVVRAQDDDGRTLFHHVCMAGRRVSQTDKIQTVKTLLELGVDHRKLSLEYKCTNKSKVKREKRSNDMSSFCFFIAQLNIANFSFLYLT